MSITATDTRSKMGLWLIFLTALSVLMTFGLACAPPFAAFAAFAALRLRRSEALVLVSLVWFANQVVGFGFLHYPHELNTYLWGVALLAAAACCTLTAARIVRRSAEKRSLSTPLAALVGAIVTFLVVVYLSGIVLGGNEAAFKLPVLANTFWTNSVTLAALLLIERAATAAGLTPRALGFSAPTLG